MATHRNPIDREAQGVTVHKVAKSQARLTLFIQGLFSHVNKIMPLLYVDFTVRSPPPPPLVTAFSSQAAPTVFSGDRSTSVSIILPLYSEVTLLL